jgi:DNA-binding CsgD family transcriptional regulator
MAVMIIDADAQVKYSFWDGTIGEELRTTFCSSASELRPEIATLVASLIEQARNSSGSEAHVVLIDQHRALRLSPLSGHDATLFALIIETDRNRNSVYRATTRFSLTRRQTEVLGLVLQGASAGEIANALSISEYTAQGYIKSLLSKTASRNRASMIAKVLDWEEPRGAPPAARGRKSIKDSDARPRENSTLANRA